MSPTSTERYTRTHLAITRVAREHELLPYVVRTLLALADRDGTATTLELIGDLTGEGAHAVGANVRRALRVLYDLELAAGERETGRQQPGHPMTIVTLTTRGEVVAGKVQRLATGPGR